MLRLLTILLCALPVFSQAPPKALPTDSQIQAQLHDRLAKSVIGKDAFTVQVKGGVVYWNGSTAVAQHKGAATRMAKSAGARRVVNNIQVKKQSASSPASKPATRIVPTAEAVPPLGTPATQPAPPPLAPPSPLKRVTVKWRETRP